MKKTHLWLLPLALLLAYPVQSVAGEPIRSEDLKNTPKCEGVPQAPGVNFNIKSMKATPACVRAHKGTTIVIQLTPKKALENVIVTVEPKKPFEDSWLRGKNEQINDLIMIEIPGEHKGTGDTTTHDYIVVVDDQKIDPRVEVEH